MEALPVLLTFRPGTALRIWPIFLSIVPSRSSRLITVYDVARLAEAIGEFPAEIIISSSSNVSWATAPVARSDKMTAEKCIFLLFTDKLP